MRKFIVVTAGFTAGFTAAYVIDKIISRSGDFKRLDLKKKTLRLINADRCERWCEENNFTLEEQYDY